MYNSLQRTFEKWFRVQGLGFRVQGLGFSVYGLAFRGLSRNGSGFRVQGLGLRLRVQGLGFRVQVEDFRELVATQKAATLALPVPVRAGNSPGSRDSLPFARPCPHVARPLKQIFKGQNWSVPLYIYYTLSLYRLLRMVACTSSEWWSGKKKKLHYSLRVLGHSTDF